MADIQPNKKTSQEPAASALALTDMLRIVQGTGTALDPYVSKKTDLGGIVSTVLAHAPVGGVQTITSSNPTKLLVDSSNAANIVLTPLGSSGGGNTSDAVPATPNAWDDEFDGTSLSSVWTLVNATNGGATCTATVHDGSLWMTDSTNVTSQGRVLTRAAPAGDFDIACKIRCHGNLTYNNIGFGLRDSVSPRHYLIRAVARAEGYAFTTPGTFVFSDPNGITSASESNFGTSSWPNTIYIRIKKLGTTTQFWVSEFGKFWFPAWTITTPTFDQVFIWYCNFNTETYPFSPMTLECEWVRRFA